MSSATPSRSASPPWGPILAAAAVVIIVIVVALWLLIRSGAMSGAGEWLHESDAGSLLRHVLGPWGILQPFADFGKFICKEPVIPASANKGVFVMAPLVSVVLAFSAWA